MRLKPRFRGSGPPSDPPPDLPLLMGILRAVHTHPDLPREPILHALTGALPRGKYQLPSIGVPLVLDRSARGPTLYPWILDSCERCTHHN